MGMGGRVIMKANHRLCFPLPHHAPLQATLPTTTTQITLQQTMRTYVAFAALLAQAACDIQFSPHVQDHMVLQRAPEKSSVYGTLTPGASAPTVTAMVSGDATYQVTGKVTGDQWVAYLKPTAAGGDYTVNVTCTGCSTNGTNTIAISDVTFGDVWYCSGQSNMALSLHYTMSRNLSHDAIRAGKYSNIRLHGLYSNMNPEFDWMTVLNATMLNNTHTHEALFFGFSAACYYFAESLTDMLGDKAPPIGLINTAWGGSTVQQWTSNATTATCADVPMSASSGSYYESRVMPFAPMTLKGFLWYQGENNMGTVFGNSAQKRGYACAVPAMLAEWRALFSQEPGTTDPLAPFGLVTLAPSGGEGHPDMGGMYFAQTASYGVLPNPAMPNSFLAHAFDLEDPWGNITCYRVHCDPMNYTNPKCHGCEGYDNSVALTNFYMGGIHPRVKKPLGERLAQAAYGQVYNAPDVQVSGPVLSGCTLEGSKLTITFNSTLLGKDSMLVDTYYKPTNASYVQILTNETLFCLQTAAGTSRDNSVCNDDGSGKAVPHPFTSGVFDSLDTWPMVNVEASGTASIVADVTGYEGKVFGVRYAWMQGYNGCCGLHPPTSGSCPLSSCPLKGSISKLPVTPFVAKIENGKCKCIAPQVCDQ